jgi:1-acyl-sn-glycerol-3-phosphate acyltransferase
MKAMLAVLRTCVAWVYTAVLWGVVSAVHVLTLRSIPDRALVGFIRFWGRSTLGILGIRIELLNPSTLETRKPRVVVCNHQSTLDLLWGAAICPPAPLVIGKRELIWIPVINVIWWALDFVRIDRQDPVRAIAAVNRVAHKITEESRSLVMAPEGTRTPDGRIGPFKKGAFHLALGSRAEIHPLVVTGAYELMRKGSFVARPGVIRLRFLPPLRPEGDAGTLAERCRALIVEAAARDARPA